jgi:hypothetical protein
MEKVQLRQKFVWSDLEPPHVPRRLRPLQREKAQRDVLQQLRAREQVHRAGPHHPRRAERRSCSHHLVPLHQQHAVPVPQKLIRHPKPRGAPRLQLGHGSRSKSRPSCRRSDFSAPPVSTTTSAEPSFSSHRASSKNWQPTRGPVQLQDAEARVGAQEGRLLRNHVLRRTTKSDTFCCFFCWGHFLQPPAPQVVPASAPAAQLICAACLCAPPVSPVWLLLSPSSPQTFSQIPFLTHPDSIYPVQRSYVSQVVSVGAPPGVREPDSSTRHNGR